MGSPFSTYSLTGLSPVESNATTPGPTGHIAMADHDQIRAMSLDNPLAWVAIVAAVTFGLIGVSGSARIGGARASARIDKA
jgi:hypothetical protein